VLSFSLIAQTETQELLDAFRLQSKKYVKDLNEFRTDQALDTFASKTNLMYLFGAGESQILQVHHHQMFRNLGRVKLVNTMSSGAGSLSHDNFRTSKSSLLHELDKGRVKNDLEISYFTDGRKLNGGLLNDSSFLFSDLGQEFLPVSLVDNSSNAKRLLLNEALSFRLTERMGLITSIDYSHTDRNYSGNGIADSAFYDTIYFTEGQSVDYFRNRNVKIGLGAEYIDSTFRMSVEMFSDNDYFYNRSKREWQGIGAGLSMLVKAGKTLYRMDGEYYFSGYRKQGFAVELTANTSVDSLNTLMFRAESRLLPPAYNELAYAGNHYVWNSVLSKYPWRNELNIEYADTAREFRASLEGMYTKDYYYFDTSMIGTQTKSAHFTNVSLFKTFSIWNIKIPLKVSANLIQSKEIRLPLINATAGLFVGMTVFKANLKLDLGAQCNWFSKYYANRFEPSTGMVYLQDDVEIGNFPFIDVVLRSTVKNASFYFMLIHVNENITGRNYYVRPNYLELGSRFIFGINWQFLN
jgi:hypothetical protein